MDRPAGRQDDLDTRSDGDDPPIPSRSVQRATKIRIRASGDHAASGFEPPFKLVHTGDFANYEQMRALYFEMCGQWRFPRLRLWKTTAENGLPSASGDPRCGCLGNQQAIFSRRAPHICDIAPRA